MGVISWIRDLFKGESVAESKERGRKLAEQEIEAINSYAKSMQPSSDRMYEIHVLDKKAREKVRFLKWKEDYENDIHSLCMYIPDITMSGHIYEVHDREAAKYSGEGAKEAEKEYIDKRVKEIQEQQICID